MPHFYSVQYEYVQNPNAKRPIILVDKYIGRDTNGVMGIDGGQFAREVLSLKNAGVTQAEVWINSKGGQWSEGVSIVSSMRNSGIDFTTINMGYADSTAGHIFQQGNTRLWAPYAIGLVHNIQGDGNEQIIEALNNSVATMLSEKSNQSVEQVRELMAAETILSYKTAKEYGFCDDKLDCSDILSFTNSSDPVEVHGYGQTQINKLLPKNKSMQALNEVLGLTNEASETAQLKAINAIIEARNTAEAKVTAQALELTNANTAKEAAEAKLLVAETNLLNATNVAKQTAAEALVKEHVGKRIADDAAMITKWTNAAIADYEGTKALIESINLNVTAPTPPAQHTRGKDAPIISVAEYRAR